MSKWFLVQVQEMESQSDSVEIESRKSTGLPTVAVQSVRILHDEAKCARASRAMDSLQLATPPDSRVVLVQVGKHYMAFPPSPRGYMAHLDQNFTVRSTFIQFN